MSENLQERPSFCDVPGGVKSDVLKKQCAPDSMGQTPPNRPDIRSKALTDTDEKKKKLQKLGLTHEKKDTFQQFSNRIKEANLNDYVKKYQMKMGNKTSTVDKDAWVDGIGGLSKREAKTLKRQLQGHTREGTTTVKKFRKGQPDIQLDPPRGGKKWGKGGVNEAGVDMYDHKRKESEMRKKARAVPTTPETLAKLKKARAGEVVDEKIDMDKPGAGSTEKRLKAKKKLDAQGVKPTTHKYSLPAGWVEDNKKTFAELSTGLLKRAAGAAKKDAATQRAEVDRHTSADRGDERIRRDSKQQALKRDNQATKFSAAADVNDSPYKKAIRAKKFTAAAKEAIGELKISTANRAGNAARKAADAARETEGKSQQEREEGRRKGAKKDAQAAKFAAYADVKQRNTAFSSKKEEVIDEKESDYADKIKAFKKRGGKVEKQPPGPISKSLFRTTVGREKRRNPGKQSTRDTFYDEVEVKELGPVGAFVARAAIKHVAKKAISKATSKNEGIFGPTSPKKTRDKLFLARSRENTIKKDNPVNELSKGLLQRAANTARDQAGQQRAVSATAASRVGDPNQPPGQNLKSKRANYQAAKKDYQAFKFGAAAKKKDAKEDWKKSRDKDFERLGPISKDEMKKKGAKEGVDESNKLQADMALDDAGIKSYWEDGKLWVDKKDVLKAEKALSKSFKKGGEPHIYYKGGFLGMWNKKRKLTG